jgi:uroporphyrinogen decarboxylase
MTHRERVIAAFNHEEKESVPANVRIIENWESHKDYFKVNTQKELFDKLGNTIRSFVPAPLDSKNYNPGSNVDSQVTIDINIWGIPEEYAGTYSDLIERPLSRAETIKDVENHTWPSGSNWDFSGMNDKLKSETNLARLSPSWMPVFSRLAELLGMEKALTDMYLNRPVIEAALHHIDKFYTEFFQNMLSTCGKNLEIFGIGDDFAANTGLMFDPEIWRELFKPLYAKYLGMAKDYGLFTFMHSCGNITSVLPDLIDSGLDGWQTVQTHLPGQSPEFIKKEFGKHITFIGAIDSTNILCSVDPESVRSHVKKQLEILSKGGGYICAPDHIILSDVPSENIEALYDECKKFRLSWL